MPNFGQVTHRHFYNLIMYASHTGSVLDLVHIPMAFINRNVLQQ